MSVVRISFLEIGAWLESGESCDQYPKGEFGYSVEQWRDEEAAEHRNQGEYTQDWDTEREE